MERDSNFKHEFCDGQMFAMAGASREHNLITANTLRQLGNALENSTCEVYISDMRVKVQRTGLYTYPDIVVVCEEPIFEVCDDNIVTLLNPLFLAEVLSESTEKFDRGRKSNHYRQIPSLAGYMLIAQDAPHVELYTRQDDGHWLLSEAQGLDSEIELSIIGRSLRLVDMYAKVKLPPRPSK
jgi:Uma2 family endonuclease